MALKKKNQKKIDAEINRVLLDDFDKIEHFVVNRWKQMIIWSLVFVVVVGVAYSIYLQQQKQQRNASNQLANATSESELIAALEQNGEAPGAVFARLRLAQLYTAAKKYDAAIGELRKISRNAEAAELNRRVRLDEAYLTEESGKLEEAATLFAEIGMDAMMSDAIRAEALYSAGRLQLALKQNELAINFLGKAQGIPVNSQAVGVWASLAKSLLLDVEAANQKK